MSNKIRGRILRDTSAGGGLLMVDGKQMPFRIEGLWLSPVAPKTNMTVEVDLDAGGVILGITAVDDAQLAKEEAQRAMNAVRDKGLEGWAALTARVSKPVLAAVAAVLLGWFFFDVVGVQVYADNHVGMTFHQLFGAVGGRDVMSALQYGGGGKTGLHSVILLLAAVAPLAPYLLTHRHASWGLMAPMVVMLYAVFRIYGGLGDASAQAGGIGGELAREMASQMLKAAMEAIQLGLGFYLSFIASLYLAGLGAVRLLAARSRL